MRMMIYLCRGMAYEIRREAVAMLSDAVSGATVEIK